jgi:hypothetical protein
MESYLKIIGLNQWWTVAELLFSLYFRYYAQTFLMESYLDSCVLRWEAVNANFIVFGLPRAKLEPTIYHTTLTPLMRFV